MKINKLKLVIFKNFIIRGVCKLFLQNMKIDSTQQDEDFLCTKQESQFAYSVKNTRFLLEDELGFSRITVIKMKIF